MPPSVTLSSPPSAGISTQPLTQARRLPQACPPSEAHPYTPPTAAHSSTEHAPVDPVSQFRPRVTFPSPVHPVSLFRPGVPRHVPWRHALSLVVPAGTVFIYPVLSCPWRDSSAPPVAEMEAVSEGPFEGPWRHIWTSASELSPRASCSCGQSCSCV